MGVTAYTELANKVDHKLLAVTSNAIKLRKITNAYAPLLTRMRRFHLLKTPTDQAANIGPGNASQVNDVSDCLGQRLAAETIRSASGAWAESADDNAHGNAAALLEFELEASMVAQMARYVRAPTTRVKTTYIVDSCKRGGAEEGDMDLQAN
ncbi:hypothetical protein Q7P37_010330 [Cladosporium fusiforme]